MEAIRFVSAAVAILITGCASPKLAKITPPALKKSVAAIPFTVIPYRQHFVIQWEDCEDQPPGTFYRVYDTDDLSYWAVYAETMLHFYVVTIEPGCHFFTVSAVNENGETRAGRDCP